MVTKPYVYQGGKTTYSQKLRQKSCVLDNPKKGVLRFKKKKKHKYQTTCGVLINCEGKLFLNISK